MGEEVANHLYTLPNLRQWREMEIYVVQFSCVEIEANVAGLDPPGIGKILRDYRGNIVLFTFDGESRQ